MNRDDARKLLLLLAGCFLIYAFGSGQLPLMGPDEPRYSQVAREMFDRGDFITPTLGGSPWFEKPVLLYWLQGAAYAVFGVNEWAARFPSLLAALWTVFLTVWIVRRFTHTYPAFLAGAVLSTSLFFIAFSHAATFDMLLTAFVTTSLFCFLMHEFQPHRPWIWYAYACVGAGVLAKGFVAPLVVGLAMAAYVVTSGRLGRLREYRILPGTLLGIAVGGIWLIPVTLIHGAHFWDDFFLKHHLMRYTTSKFHRSGGFLFYVPVFLAGSYPWTPALFLKSESFPGARSLRRMAWCWFLSSFVFFSLSQSKLPGYILPLMPAFAVLAGLSLYDVPRHWKRPLVLFGALQALMVAALLLSAGSFGVPAAPIYAATALIAGLVGTGIYFFHKRKWLIAATCNALIPLVAVLIAVAGIYPATSWDETRALAGAVMPELNRQHKLVLYHVYNFPMVYYTNAQVALTSDGYFPPLKTDADLLRYLQHHGETYVVVGNDEMEWIRHEGKLHVRSIIRGATQSIVLLSVGPPPR